MKDDERLIDRRFITVGEHFALEQPALRPLPAEPFDYAGVDSFRVDRSLASMCGGPGTRFRPVTPDGASRSASEQRPSRPWTVLR